MGHPLPATLKGRRPLEHGCALGHGGLCRVVGSSRRSTLESDFVPVACWLQAASPILQSLASRIGPRSVKLKEAEGPAHVELQDGTPVCNAIRIKRNRKGPSLSGAELRRLPLRNWVNYAVAQAALMPREGDSGVAPSSRRAPMKRAISPLPQSGPHVVAGSRTISSRTWPAPIAPMCMTTHASP